MQTLKYRVIVPLASVCLLAGAFTSFAQTPQIVPTPITAEQAFDAVQHQVDPATGLPARVVLVDVRSHAEYYWVGTAAKVTSITPKKGAVLTPDFGKVKLVLLNKFLTFRVHGKLHLLQVDKVASMAMSPIAFNAPYESWDEATSSMKINADFVTLMNPMEGAVVIFYCRSGSRSDAKNAVAASIPERFQAVYEIDRGDTTSYGGFEGASYGNVFNGYRGFPGRDTWDQTYPSVAWKDAGLPMITGAKPPAVPFQ